MVQSVSEQVAGAAGAAFAPEFRMQPPRSELLELLDPDGHSSEPYQIGKWRSCRLGMIYLFRLNHRYVVEVAWRPRL